jgi:4-hydroxy-3-polyprenylbenzoate decarboxylase
MAYQDLRSFIALLEERGQLVRIKEPVSADLEITEIADRMVKVDGPALLFENVIGKEFPVVIGLMGTRERMAWALGVNDLEDPANRIRKLLDIKLGGGILGLASNHPSRKSSGAVTKLI